MRLPALLLAATLASLSSTINGEVDLCKRQPFRGRCPSKDGTSQMRSQFVLRYYMRDGECVSYPYGHCANDDSEPRLFRYKEECEDACLSAPGNLGTPKESKVTVAVSQSETTEKTTTERSTTTTSSTASTPSTPSTPSTTAPRTECERRRAHQGGLIRGGFVPECTEDGAFERRQCEPNSHYCFCVDSRGIELPNSRMRGKPDCESIATAGASKTNECVGGAVPGPCVNSLLRWYYDETTRKCKSFHYSGCGGNGNNYQTEISCNERCAPLPVGLPKCERGEPLKTVIGAPINCAKRDCPSGYECSVVQGSSVCCPQNDKGVGALDSGRPADVCQMSKERGPCDHYELRFYYNPESKECKYFFYGGCEGNGNNFEKVEECEHRCNVTRAPRWGTVSHPLNPNQPQGTIPGIRVSQTTRRNHPTTATTTTQRTTHTTTTQKPSTTRSTTPAPLQNVFSLKPQQPEPDLTLLEMNRCKHPRDAGTCRGQFVRWFFNTENANCEVFTYSGCAGNGNNFATKEECSLTCSRSAQTTTTPAPETVPPEIANVCLHDVDAGECNGVFKRFAFDGETGECRSFTYGGCGGNGNNFATLEDCEGKCHGVKLPKGTPSSVHSHVTTPSPIFPSVNVCDHPVDKGPCAGSFQRYAFDQLTGDCLQFTYGGCGGNGNNFASSSECRKECMKNQKVIKNGQSTDVMRCPPPPHCESECSLSRDSHGCFTCNCLKKRLPPAPVPQSTHATCSPIDLRSCVEPCIVFQNRKGCKECVCPLPGGPSLRQQSSATRQPTRFAQPPATQSGVPRPPSPPSPPAPRLNSVRNINTFDKRPLAPLENPTVAPTRFPPRLFTFTTPRRPGPQPPQASNIPTVLTEKCLQPVDAGPCSHFVDRYYFDPEDGQCHPFKYGGCAGNRNHFFTLRECEIHCARFSHFVAPSSQSEQAESIGIRIHPPSAQKNAQVSRRLKSNEFEEDLDLPVPDRRPIAPPGTQFGSRSGSVKALGTTMTTVRTTTRRPTTRITTPEYEDSYEETTTRRSTPRTTTRPRIEDEYSEESVEVVMTKTTLRPTTTTISDQKLEEMIRKAEKEDKSLEKEEKEEIVEKIETGKMEMNGNESRPAVIERDSEELSEESGMVPEIGNSSEEVIEGRALKNMESVEVEKAEAGNGSAKAEPAKTFASKLRESGQVLDRLTKTFDNRIGEEVLEKLKPTEETVSNEMELEQVEKDLGAVDGENLKPELKSEEAELVDRVENSKSGEIQSSLGPDGVEEGKPVSVLKSEESEAVEELKPALKSAEVGPVEPIRPTELELKPKDHSNSDSLETVEEDDSLEALIRNPPPPPTPKSVVPVTEIESTFVSTSTTHETSTSATATTTHELREVKISPRKPTTTAPELLEMMRIASEVIDVEKLGKDDEEIKELTEETSVGTTVTTATPPPVPIHPQAAGREPVPSRPVGIGRNMENLDIDHLAAPPPEARPVAPLVVPPPVAIPVKQEQINPVIVCAMPPDAGICKNYVPRWFFNAQTGQCEQFSYGSCDGNANNFLDRSTCEIRCLPMHRPTNILSKVPERCARDRDAGFSGGYNVKWYFNLNNLRCEQFIYHGKGGNENRFETLNDCENACYVKSGNKNIFSTTRLVQTQPPTTITTTTRLTNPPTTTTTQASTQSSMMTPVITTTIQTQTPPQPAPEPAIVSKESQEVFDKEYSAENEEGDDEEDEDALLQPIQPIGDHIKSFEKIDESKLTPPSESHSEDGLQSALPGAQPHPPAVRGDKTVIVEQPNPISKLDQPEYKAEPITPQNGPLNPNANQPIVGPSPPESLNYQTGQRSKAHGVNNFQDLNAIDIEKFDMIDDGETVEGGQVVVPACPNGLQAHRYVDGRPVQCLPGRNQCPADSVCYFNGLDYFCCPNVDDPYDKHIFGGYDGEETKQGYKVFGPLKIRRLRDAPMRAKRSLRQKRQTSFSMDDIVMPLRFDAEKPHQFASASAVMSSNRRRKQPRNWASKDFNTGDISICIQPLQRGDCHAQHVRYFYDRNTDSCRLFYYSGCKGNANNFGSLEDCERLCVIAQRSTQEQPVDSRPVPPGQCPGDVLPLGGKAPVLCGNNTDSIDCPSGYYCRTGPPNVCCPGQDPTRFLMQGVLNSPSKIRFEPESVEELLDRTPTTEATTTTTKKTYLEVPEFICPDASDPLYGKNGRPLLCGAGFDGVKMCPRGFYCAIDSGRGTRLCCSLLGSASRIPNEQIDAPHFPRRRNQAEVMDRGSLPDDFTPQSHQQSAEEEETFSITDDHRSPIAPNDEEKEGQAVGLAPTQQREAEYDQHEEDGDGEVEYEESGESDGFAKLQMKPPGPVNQHQQFAKVPESDGGVNIEIENETNVDGETPAILKESQDLSICQMTPSIGRVCREDEPSPRTNLHYFYSEKDKRCKLYFYKGCGGNANRFEKKAQCEAACVRL
ncbi:unnamed protein product, partial [Mesorhabditis belari]|uniref:Papilin n=1 Tax=Mesorhabditis belari TaxID=2138241 RepID=A0AAF3EG32_9BILA